MAPQMYRIVVAGRLSDHFASGFDKMTQHHDGTNTILEGEFVDQAHLHGVLDQIRGLGITVTSFAATDNQQGPSDLASAYTAATTMRVVGVTTEPAVSKVADKLQMLEVPIPRPQGDQVAIKLCASSMHIDEIYAAQGTALGRFFGPKNVSQNNPYILGSSVSGTVVARGLNSNKFDVGDQVIVIPNEKGESGSWATYRCVADSMVISKPQELSHVEAAAITMAACVALAAVQRSHVAAGDRCVVVGASGSIGSIVMQFLKSRGVPCHGREQWVKRGIRPGVRRRRGHRLQPARVRRVPGRP